MPVQVWFCVAEDRVVHARARGCSSDCAGRISGILKEVCGNLSVQIPELLLVAREYQDAASWEPGIVVQT